VDARAVPREEPFARRAIRAKMKKNAPQVKKNTLQPKLSETRKNADGVEGSP